MMFAPHLEARDPAANPWRAWRIEARRGLRGWTTAMRKSGRLRTARRTGQIDPLRLIAIEAWMTVFSCEAVISPTRRQAHCDLNGRDDFHFVDDNTRLYVIGTGHVFGGIAPSN